MKKLLCAFFVLSCMCLGAGAQDAPPKQAADGRRVYADFERVENERIVSNNGGIISVEGYQQNNVQPARFSNSEKPYPRPPLYFMPKGATSMAVAFEFDIRIPNQYAGVFCEIQGAAKQNDKFVAEDMSGYEFLEMQIGGQSVERVTVKIVSRDNGVSATSDAFPEFVLKLSPGFNTYRLALKKFVQPNWVEDKVKVKDVLRKLTAVQIHSLTVPSKGAVVVDNVVFVK